MLNFIVRKLAPNAYQQGCTDGQKQWEENYARSQRDLEAVRAELKKAVVEVIYARSSRDNLNAGLSHIEKHLAENPRISKTSVRKALSQALQIVAKQ